MYVYGDGSVAVTVNGYIINSGYVETRNNELSTSIDFEVLLTRTAIVNDRILVVTGISNTNNSSMGVNVNFIEDI